MNRIFAHDLMKEGGSWLAQARDFLQRRVPQGENLTWGSEEPVRITVRQIEELAAEVAAKAINEDRKNPKDLKELVHACPLGWNGTKLIRGRWTTEEDIIEWIGKLQELAGVK